MNFEEETRVLQRFDDYCLKKSLELPLTYDDKKKLIQMIVMLEKLQKGNPQRYLSTVKRMGLEKILDQNDHEISIFEAILTFYDASMKPQSPPKKEYDNIFELIKSNQWDSISKLLNQNSQAATTLHSTYGLPLHLLCSAQLTYCPTLDSMSLFVSLFPSALTTLSPSGMYPLHMWLINWRHFENKGSLELVENIFHLLLKTDSRVVALISKELPNSSSDDLVSIPDMKPLPIFSQYGWGRMLPLHIACRNSLPISAVRHLLNSYRQGIREFDEHGLTALHWQLVSPFGSKVDIVRELISVYPEVALLSDETFGSLPIHLASMSPRTPLEVIQLLCHSFPQGCSLQDRHGYLPLQYACASLLPYPIIKAIVELYPEGCSYSTTTTGNILPLHLYLTAGGEEINVIYLITKNDLPKLTRDNSIICTGGRSWVYLVSVANRTNSNLFIAAVDWIVREIYREEGCKGVYRLAYVLNEQHQVLVESCSPHIQQFFHQYLLLCDRYFLLPSESISQTLSSLTVTAYDYLASNFYRKCFQFCVQDNIDAVSDVSSLGDSCDPSAVDKNFTPDFYRADSHQAEIRKGGMTSSEFYEFAQLVGLNFSSDGKIDELAILDLYSTLLQSSDGNLTEEFLVGYCEEYFQHPRKIKLKFSCHPQHAQYQYLLREKELIGSNYIIKLLDAPSTDILLSGLASYFHPLYDFRKFNSVVAMAFYDSNLDFVFRNEQPNNIEVKRIMKQIAYAILDCHERGVIHGNLSMKNILRSESSYVLSSFYCLEEKQSTDRHFHFENIDLEPPTTGYLPPESFILTNNKNSPGSSLRISAQSSFEKANRLSWISDDSRDTFQICNFAKYIEKEDSKSITSDIVTSPPVNLSSLNVGLDIWAYGMILYAFLTGDHFFPIDRNENVCRPEELIPVLATLKIDIVESKINKKVPDLLASNLLLQLLQPMSAKRIASFHHILSHPYFQDQILYEDVSHTGDQMINQTPKIPSPVSRPSSQYDRYSTQYKSRKYRAVKNFPADVLSMIKILNIHNLRKHRAGVKGTYHPTSFLLFNRKLTSPLRSISLEKDDESDILSGVPDVPPLVTSRVQRWINKLYNYFVLIDQYHNQSTPRTIDHDILLALNEICNENELYLYLVDEITLEPVLGEKSEQNIFPILITHPSAVIPIILPLLRETYKMICPARFVENMGHCFGYPLDLVPFNWIDAIEHILGSFESSQRCKELRNWKSYVLKNISVLSDNSSSAKDDPESCLRLSVDYFTQFLDESDPYQMWCGLTKIYLTEELHCWTKENIQLLLHNDSVVNTTELKSDSCSEESDLNRMNAVLFPPVTHEKLINSKPFQQQVSSKIEPILRTSQDTRTPSPSKKVGFFIETPSESKQYRSDNSNELKDVSDGNRDPKSEFTPTSSPIKLAPLMKGRIYKQPTSISANRSFNIMKQWTKRYLILEPQTYILKYGVSEAALCSSNGVKGSIQLEVGMTCQKGKKSKYFELYRGDSCILRSIAETDEERDRWIHAIQTAIQDLEAVTRRQESS